MTSTTIRINGKSAGEHLPEPRSCSLRSGCNRDDLAPFVKPARRTHPVGNIRGGALRAGAELRQFEHAVVGTTHPHAALRRFSFRNTHKLANSIQFDSIQCHSFSLSHD